MAGKIRLFLTAIRKTGGIASLAVKGRRALRDEGMRGVKLRMQILRRDHAPELNDLGRPLPFSIPQALANAQRWCTGDNPAVSILIVNWNAAPLTLECVRQIWANTEGVSYEKIVVDSGSEPPTVLPLRNLGSGARLLELGVNRFFGEANNIAAEQAAGKYLCFLNNDAFVQPGWLCALVDEMVKTPEAGAFAGDAGAKKTILLSVGRFFLGKRKDLLISAFRALVEKFGGELELHLAGSSIPHPLHMAHLGDLKNMVGDLPVEFHVNPTPAVLATLYRDAAIYWHANGLQADLERGPEKAEHFGISIVEAMSAQCVPLAFNAGGPREIITHGADGFLYDTTDSLVELTLDLLGDNGAGRRVVMGRAAGKTAERYTVERFIARMRQLVDAATVAPASGR